MKPEILLGDEAVTLGAIHAGLSAGYSYPGTPASEIMEYLIKAAAKTKSFLASWSVNEKVAYEEALGVSFAGKRALVSMKHVGLNVAADPFMNSALTGANGGVVVVPPRARPPRSSPPPPPPPGAGWSPPPPMTPECTAPRTSRTAVFTLISPRFPVSSPRTIRKPTK